MRTTLLIVLLLISAAGMLAYHAYNKPPALSESPAMPAPSPNTAPVHADPTPHQLLVAERNRHRLPPDRRFTQAFAQIAQIHAGGSTSPVQILSRTDDWQIHLADTPIANLPDLPNFATALSALSDYANKLALPTATNEQTRVTQQELEQAGFSPVQLHDLLLKLNRSWADQAFQPQVLRMMADSMARLAVVSMGDGMENDHWMSRALALLALAKAQKLTGMERTESMLAYALSYPDHATQIAAGLPIDDPWRQYLSADSEPLIKVALQHPPESIAGYLGLRLAAERQQFATWRRILNRYSGNTYPAYLLATGYQLRRFELNRWFTLSLPQILVAEVGGSSNSKFLALWQNISRQLPHDVRAFSDLLISELLQVNHTYLSNEFDAALTQQAQAFADGLIGNEDWQAFYRGYYLESLRAAGKFYLYSLSSLSATEDYANALRAADNPLVRDLGASFHALAHSRQNSTATTALLDRLQNELLGSRFLFNRFLEAIFQQAEYGSTLAQQIQPLLLKRLDSRLWDRTLYGSFLHTRLLNLAAAETLFQSIPLSQAEPGLHRYSYLSAYFGQQAQLLELCRRDDIDPELKLTALQQLDSDTQYRDAAFTIYKSLHMQNPESWPMTKAYISALEARQEYAAAAEVAQQWLHNKPDTASGFEELFATISLSKNQQQLGQLDTAWKTISHKLDSQQAGVLRQAYRVLRTQGRDDQALTLAKRLQQRYPDHIDSLTPLLESLWRNGDHPAAVAALQNFKPAIDVWAWRDVIGRSFAETFKQDSAAGLEAFSHLLNHFPHDRLRQLATAVAREKNYELAFQMADRLQYQGMGIAAYKLQAYEYLAKWQNLHTASTWLKQNLPAQWRNPLSNIIFDARQYHLLWDFIGEPDPNNYPQGVWLVRAAAQALGANFSAEQNQQLENYFADADSDYYHMLARLALGHDSAKHLLEQPQSLDRIAEISFYRALDDFRNANYSSAAEWLYLTLASGATRKAEYKWAYNLLTSWRSQRRSLALSAPLLIAKLHTNDEFAQNAP